MNPKGMDEHFGERTWKMFLVGQKGYRLNT